MLRGKPGERDMANFVIIRHKKLKSVGHVAAAIKHNSRGMDVPNADPARSPMNVVSGGGMLTLSSNLGTCTIKSTQPNPVVAIEYLVTASPERINDPTFDREGYFNDAKAYLDNLLGPENLVHCAIHMDETSPHMQIIYTPIVAVAASTRRRSVVVGKNEDGTQRRETRDFSTSAGRALKAKMFTDKTASKTLQSDFAAKVGAKYGLERGIERSKARHEPIQKIYPQVLKKIEVGEEKNRLIEARTEELLARHEQISEDAAARKLPRPVRIRDVDVTPQVVSKNMFGISTYETTEEVAERITDDLARYYAPLHEAAQLQQSAEIRAGQLTAKVKQLEAELEPLRPLVEGLDTQGVSVVLSYAGKLAEEERVKTGWRAEIERRVSAIPSLLRMSGPVATFARIAMDFMSKVAGNASSVDWRGVEKDSMKQIIEDGWAPRKAGQVIQDHSPGQVGRDPVKMAQELEALSETAEPRPQKPTTPSYGLGS